MSQTGPDLRLVVNEPEPPDPLIGRTLEGRYLIEKVLGRGGMGLVYAAKHAILGKRLAIKVLKPEVSRDEAVIARFRREAQSASAIGSPHICDVSDFGTMPDGSTYFVMEYLDGPSLSDAMTTQRPMSIARILSVGMQLCEALGAAHERGIVHRDLKPDNVHLVHQGTRDDFVKVLDFGIAKVGGAADKKLTQAGQVFGTPHYMSPEQCSGRDVDHRTDIYALGVILYEMATGQVPFDADNLMGVLTKHVYERPIPPREFPPPVDVPPGLESVILRCLEKQPEARYATMVDLRADLQKVSQGQTPNAVLDAVDRASAAPRAPMGSAPALEVSPGGMPGKASIEMDAQPTPSSGSRGLLMVGGVLFVLLLGAGAFAAAFFLGGDDPTPVAASEPPAVEPTRAPAPEPTPTAPVAVEPTPPAPVVAAQPEATVVHVTSDPVAAEVYAGDGSLLGNAPIDLPRPAQGETVEVSVRMAGYESRNFTVSHLTSENVTVRLDPSRTARAPQVRRPLQPLAPPTPQPLAPSPVIQRRPPSRTTGSEIISPW